MSDPNGTPHVSIRIVATGRITSEWFTIRTADSKTMTPRLQWRPS